MNNLEGGEILKVQPMLPMVASAPTDKYYVRPCYVQYQNEIFRILGTNTRAITVTGTPGIGKSIFYTHMFNEMRKSPKFAGRTYITAAFDSERQLLEASLWLPGDDNSTAISEYEFRMTYATYPGAIHLYDGPPRNIQSASIMIAFTSPNAAWFNYLRKQSQHQTLFMPTWDANELLEACSNLELQLTKRDVLNRFYLFGGVARYCLTQSKVFLAVGEGDLDKAIQKIRDISGVKSCLEDKLDANEVIHRIFHYRPRDKEWYEYELEFGSKDIAFRVQKRLDAITDSKRLELLNYLEGDSRGSIFRGWVFEGFAHRQLSQGGEFECRNLRSEADLSLVLQASAIHRIDPLKSAMDFCDDIYLKPTASNFPSIDSLYADDKTGMVYLFQSTLNKHHPISPDGVLRALKSFVRNNLELSTVALIFVVPQGIAQEYAVQPFSMQTLDVENMSLTQVSGIGDATAEKLKNRGISTPSDLLIAVQNKETEKYSMCRKAAESFAEKVEADGDGQHITKQIADIAQYVIGLDISQGPE